jgi:hypothetical protein
VEKADLTLSKEQTVPIEEQPPAKMQRAFCILTLSAHVQAVIIKKQLPTKNGEGQFPSPAPEALFYAFGLSGFFFGLGAGVCFL